GGDPLGAAGGGGHGPGGGRGAGGVWWVAGRGSPDSRAPARGPRRLGTPAEEEARTDYLHPGRHDDEPAERVEHHEEREQEPHLGLELQVREPPEDGAGHHRRRGEDDRLAGGGGGVVDRLVEAPALVESVDHAAEVVDAVVYPYT